MSEKSLAETVILQSIEDLFSRNDREESMRFFKGKGFRLSRTSPVSALMRGRKYLKSTEALTPWTDRPICAAG